MNYYTMSDTRIKNFHHAKQTSNFKRVGSVGENY